MPRRLLGWISAVTAAAAVLGLPVPARAQMGIGARFAFVSGADSPVLEGTNETKARFAGAFVRLRSGRVGLEASMDYRSMKDATETVAVKSYPLQGSLLYYLSTGGIAPYLIGGIGYYTLRLDEAAAGNLDLNPTGHSVGYHAGAGTEVLLGRRASIFIDYRYTFVDMPSFGNPSATAAKAALAPALLATGNGLGIDTKGSMWTTGVTIYF